MILIETLGWHAGLRFEDLLCTNPSIIRRGVKLCKPMEMSVEHYVSDRAILVPGRDDLLTTGVIINFRKKGWTPMSRKLNYGDRRVISRAVACRQDCDLRSIVFFFIPQTAPDDAPNCFFRRFAFEA